MFRLLYQGPQSHTFACAPTLRKEIKLAVVALKHNLHHYELHWMTGWLLVASGAGASRQCATAMYLEFVSAFGLAYHGDLSRNHDLGQSSSES
eukprot:SAG31_NODE_366_length_16817_cov_17.317921_15_plen_93_part_00